jgi:hypothetical protein
MGFFKSLFGSAPSGPSQEEIAARKKQQAQLEQQREQAERESARLRKKRISNRSARRAGLRGRISLIKGSELGEDDKLG